jgi:hypothetical protein
VLCCVCRYNDFKKYADEDAAAEYMYGMECLFRFYSYGLEDNFRVPLYKVRGPGLIALTPADIWCQLRGSPGYTSLVAGLGLSCIWEPGLASGRYKRCVVRGVSWGSAALCNLRCLLQDFEQLVLKDYQVYNSLYGLEKFWAFHHYAGVPQDAVVSLPPSGQSAHELAVSNHTRLCTQRCMFALLLR